VGRLQTQVKVSGLERVGDAGRGSRTLAGRLIVKSRSAASHGLSCSSDRARGPAAATSAERRSEEHRLDQIRTQAVI
jgi:hypothetical protein